MTYSNPFLKTPARPGSGDVHLTLLPPCNPTFNVLNYTYPLKLVPSAPHILSEEVRSKSKAPSQNVHESNGDPIRKPPSPPSSVPLLFMLSYGGGLLPPDAIDLNVRLDPGTRLTIATQGSTKIFPSEPFQQARTQNFPPISSPPQKLARSSAGLPTATQTLTVHLAAHSALCLTPDPTQPFRASKYIQRQIFTVDPTASLLLLDWTTEGRRARGESWDADLWRGCNEIWREMGTSKDGAPVQTKLQLRDQVILEGEDEGPLGSGPNSGSGHGMRALKEQGIGCFGTLVALGDVVKDIGDFFMQEFESLPRVGGRDWGDREEPKNESMDEEAVRRRRREAWRKERVKLEKQEGVLWTSARVRGLVLIKLSARDAHGARRWLGEMLTFEGTVAREFGEGGLMCVR